MKRVTGCLLALLMICLLPLCAGAEETDRHYTFDLSVNNSHEVQVQPGQVVTVVLTLQRTDSADPYRMYAMQDEIRYDDSFVKVVDNGWIVTQDVQTQDIALRTGGREFYMNYVSFSDGADWNASQIVGTFQLEVVGTEGATTLTSQNYKVTSEDGTVLYDTDASDLTLIISGACTVTFQTNGGTELDPVTADYGQLLEKPADPEREGYQLEGWYKDADLTELWDFETDKVTGNMTLYAGWAEAKALSWWERLLQTLGNFWKHVKEAVTEKPWLLAIPAVLLALLLWLLLRGKNCRVIFETNGGSPLESMTVRRGRTTGSLPTPTRPGSVFGGWYKDTALTKPWYGDIDKVRKKKTRLYARWR